MLYSGSMARWTYVGFTFLLIAAVLTGTWLLIRKPTGQGTVGVPPGDKVNVWLGREAVIVEGDRIDPIEQISLSRDGKPLDHAPPCWRADRAGAVLFCDVNSGPIDLEVSTRHRRTTHRLDRSAPRNAVSLQHISLQLPENASPHGVPDTALAFSPDSRRLAIGAASGEVKVVQSLPCGDPNPPPTHELQVAEGIAKTLVFSADGGVLVLGEQSPDGFVRGLDARDGRELWQFRLAEDLGTSRASPDLPFPLYQFPGAYRLIALDDGDVLVLGLHSWQPDAATRTARSRIYRFDARTGTQRWCYPADKPAERNMTWMDATPDGSRIVAAKTLPGAGQATSRDGPLEVVALDGRTGRETGRMVVEPLKPFFNSVFFWQSLSLRKDGRSALLGLDDGRLWALNLDAEGGLSERWRMDLGVPVKVGGIDVHCSVGWTLAWEDAFVAQVDRSWEKFGAGANTGLPQDIHPEASSLQAFDADDPRPQRLWRYDVDGRPQGLWLSPDRRWLAFAYEKPEGQDARGKSTPADYGVAVFDLTRQGTGAQRLAYRYSTEGPLSFAGAFSPDNRFLAVTEGPRPGPDRLSTTRTYRVLVLH
jgi:hypothetical protein